MKSENVIQLQAKWICLKKASSHYYHIIKKLTSTQQPYTKVGIHLCIHVLIYIHILKYIVCIYIHALVYIHTHGGLDAYSGADGKTW